MEKTRRPKRRKRRKNRVPTELVDTRPIEEVLADLGVSDWDIALIGDGSGRHWKEKGAGWCCVLIEKHFNARSIFFGGANSLTTHLSELLPYIHALTWHSQTRSNKTIEVIKRNIRAIIVTDSQNLSVVGTNACKGRIPNKVPALYQTLLAFTYRGYNIDFVKIPRDSIAINVLCDGIAYKANRAMREIDLPTDDQGKPFTLDNFN